MQLALAITWLAVGVYAIASAQRQRRYVNSLPPVGGNPQIKRRRIAILVIGVVATVSGLWRLAIVFGLATP